MRTRLPLLALAVLSLFAAAACSSDDDPSTVEAGEEQEEQVAEFNDADVAFAQQMIPHHQQAVGMAQLAADRAERQEVKDLAARVEAAQAPEIARLEGWIGEWGEDLPRSEEHTSELRSLMRTSYAVFCLNQNKHIIQ